MQAKICHPTPKSWQFCNNLDASSEHILSALNRLRFPNTFIYLLQAGTKSAGTANNDMQYKYWRILS